MPVPDTIAAVKGFRDVLPDESRRWRALEDVAEEVFSRYGFGEIRLPVVERTDIFARSLGDTTDIVEKEMYSFVDRDASGLTLRPHATAVAVRAFGLANLGALCPDCHRRLERNPLRILDCKVESCRQVVARAPVMLDSLCDGCRMHFAEVRALIEQEHVPYVVNPRLVRGLDY